MIRTYGSWLSKKIAILDLCHSRMLLQISSLASVLKSNKINTPIHRKCPPWLDAAGLQLNYNPAQGMHSLSERTSCHKSSWSLEATKFGFRLFQLLWNLAGTSEALLPRCLSIFRAIEPLVITSNLATLKLHQILRYNVVKLVNRGPGAGILIKRHQNLFVARYNKERLLGNSNLCFTQNVSYPK